jgi:hypothetical protein
VEEVDAVPVTDTVSDTVPDVDDESESVALTEPDKLTLDDSEIVDDVESETDALSEIVEDSDIVPDADNDAVLEADKVAEPLPVFVLVTELETVPVSDPDSDGEREALSEMELESDTVELAESLTDRVVVGVTEGVGVIDDDGVGAPPNRYTSSNDGIRHVTDEKDADTITHVADVPLIEITFPVVSLSKPVPVNVTKVPPYRLPSNCDTLSTTKSY